MNEHFDVVIVGGGHAGAQAAIALRQAKFEGSIVIISDEPELPYGRPPLSKEYLLGEKSFERILIRPAAYWSEHMVEMKLSSKVSTVDPSFHAVTLRDGSQITYGRLIWAAGGTPRKLACPGETEFLGCLSQEWQDNCARLRECD